MMNFLFGVIVGIAIAVCGYKPYQIEMEYRHNIVAGLKTQTPIDCITTVNLLSPPSESKLTE